jgi:hypothetical protein
LEYFDALNSTNFLFFGHVPVTRTIEYELFCHIPRGTDQKGTYLIKNLSTSCTFLSYPQRNGQKGTLPYKKLTAMMS